ncbi:MAG: hypothetical protein ACXVLQ_17195 [Bacteriovorax sp.]
MKKFYVLIYLFISLLPLSALAAVKWDESVTPLLPSPFQKIKINKSTMADVEKLIGKAALVEKNKHYYERDGLKYAVEIIYEKRIVKELSFTFTKVHPSFVKLGLNLNEMTPYPVRENSSGHLFKYSDNRGDIIVDPLDKAIYSLRFK